MATIMVVDDQDDIRFSIKKLLEKNGFTVVTAKDGDDCLAKLKQQKVDLIILDIMMPGLPVKQLVQMLANVNTKIVFLSAVMMSESEKKAMMSTKNIAGFIQKPPESQELVSYIAKILK